MRSNSTGRFRLCHRPCGGNRSVTGWYRPWLRRKSPTPAHAVSGT